MNLPANQCKTGRLNLTLFFSFLLLKGAEEWEGLLLDLLRAKLIRTNEFTALLAAGITYFELNHILLLDCCV